MSELGDIRSAIQSALSTALTPAYTSIERGYTDPAVVPNVPVGMVYNASQSATRIEFGQRGRVITVLVLLVRVADPHGVTTQTDLMETDLDTAQAALEGAQIGGEGAGVYVTTKGVDETDDTRTLGGLIVEVDVEA